MSWDIFIQDLPAVRSVAEIPTDFFPKPVGRRGDLVARVRENFPDADFSDPTYGRIRRATYSVEIAFGSHEDVLGITLRVSGSRESLDIVNKLVVLFGRRAIDSWTGELYDPVVASESFREWKEFQEELQ